MARAVQAGRHTCEAGFSLLVLRPYSPAGSRVSSRNPFASAVRKIFLTDRFYVMPELGMMGYDEVMMTVSGGYVVSRRQVLPSY